MYPPENAHLFNWVKSTLKRKRNEIGDKGKKDKNRREEQNKVKRTIKEKRKQRDEK
jgi:hypothetical protein